MDVVPDARAVHIYSVLEFSCSKPALLTRDCSEFSSGTRTIVIDGTRINIAGSADGTQVLITDPAAAGFGELSAMFRSVQEWTYQTNSRYELVKKTVLARGIHVQLAVPAAQGGIVLAYVVTFDGDAYSVLEGFTQP